MSGDEHALASVEEALEAAARVVLSRPRYAGPERRAAELVRNRREWLLDLIEASPTLRAAARDLLRSASGPGRLLLHPDPEVAAGVRRLLNGANGTGGRSAAAAERKVRRLTEARNKLREKLASFRQKLEYAHADAARLRAELAEARRGMADAEEELAGLRARLAAQQRRLQNPRSLAAALLAALPQPADGAAAEPDALRRGLRELLEPPRPASLSVGRCRELRVTPLGGDDHIGGSCLLVEAGDTSLLVDAGIRPGTPPQPPRDVAEALTARPEAVIVTHAHNDHCGYVPALAHRLPRLRIIATPESCRLMPVMWQDALKVMRRHTAGASSGGSWTPLYEQDAVDVAMERLEELPTGAPRRVGDLTVELFPAGHILGAAGAVISAGERRVVVTGDISGFRQASVDGYRLPDGARGADLLVLESTCCGEEHGDHRARVGELLGIVEEVHAAAGRVLIPAFALGRAQELALLLREHLPHVPVLIDGMAAEVSAVYETADGPGERRLSIFGGNVTAAGHPRDFDGFTKGVVIAPAGMLTGGPAVDWAARILPEPHSAVLLAGYQDDSSGGRRLLQDVREGAAEHLLPGNRPVPLRARVHQVRLSAHADRHGLLQIAKEVSARQTMLVHGLPFRQRAFREILHVRHHRTVDTRPWS
ncbi:MBL fold metallo-hydrolase [Thermomonospora curvata]|mgnify:FL=1|uniref:Beta-lactamase domain protein n=1 Tax=Thermomonospora curvata (strain ATCC 19995 / DSM 43183 / JCM 3096 / KCTC 9072 / NBRC 15933 / NCIMB 10081 / Henssen B9) TaxID=471852 RepID=D1ADL9_THECD|nr:MBL fold metallo-hydrolase [Thermomonospora curvata]ACY97479.1 beta-lactamase domain protein [Thermomonospora curvata DSM 43183]